MVLVVTNASLTLKTYINNQNFITKSHKSLIFYQTPKFTIPQKHTKFNQIKHANEHSNLTHSKLVLNY